METSGGMIVGKDRYFADRYWNGVVGDLIVYNRVLTDDERLLVRNYLAIKWGVTI
jgi:hypothetical protein